MMADNAVYAHGEMLTSDQNPGSPERFDSAPPKIPDHRLLRRIGRGSYGEVWLALNAMNKWTAVKVVLRRDEEYRRAYEQEFRGLRRYDDLSGSDGSLMPIKNVGENVESGYFYYAMELADDANTLRPLPRPQTVGEDLVEAAQMAANYRPRTLSEELRRQGRLPAHECVEYGLALAESLKVLHEGGLVHRDVKPSNIIFVNSRPKLADVGLVAAADATMNSFAGTSGFVPLHGAGEPTGDIFALGKVLYMVATGNAVLDFPRPISELELLPDEERKKRDELQAIYEKACDPTPADRQPSAQALRDELEMLRRNDSVVRLRQLEAERRSFEVQRVQAQRRRKKFAVYAVSVLVIAAIGICALLIYTWRLRTEHQSTLAELQANKFSRMLDRASGWSQADWRKIEEAARQSKNGGADESIVSQAISTMSGLDAVIAHKWPKLEASSAAFAQDGTCLLAGFKTNRAMLIRDTTNLLELPVVGEGQACWSREGEPLIWQRGSNSCVLREAHTGVPRREFFLRAGEHVIFGNQPAMAVTPDGSMVAAALVCSNQARVVAWNVQDGRVLGETSRSVSSLSFSPDGSLLAGGDEAGNTFIWKTSPFTGLAELPPAKRPNPITCLAFGEDRVVPKESRNTAKRWLLAVGDSGADIAIWDLTKRLPRCFCAGSDYNVQSVAFSKDGLILASAGRNAPRIWDAMSGKLLLRINETSASDTLALAFNQRGDRLLVGANSSSSVSSVELVDLEWHRGIKRLPGLSSHVRKVWFSPDSRLIAALPDDWSLAIWDTKSGELKHLFETSGALADNADGAFDTDGKRFGFAAGEEAWLFDVEAGRVLDNWRIPYGFGEEIQFDGQGRFLLVRQQPIEDNDEIWGWAVYELPKNREAKVILRQTDLSYLPISMAFPPPGSQFVVTTQDRATKEDWLRAFDIKTGEKRWEVDLHHQRTWQLLKTSPDGGWGGFTDYTDRETQFIRLANGKLDFIFPGECLALGPNGREYAIGEGDDRWILRSVDLSQMPIHFGFDGHQVTDTYRFSRDGGFIAWGTRDGTVLLAEISAVRQRLSSLRR